jgi:hypothetical protein
MAQNITQDSIVFASVRGNSSKPGPQETTKGNLVTEVNSVGCPILGSKRTVHVVLAQII